MQREPMTSYLHDNAKLDRDYDRLGEIQFQFGQRIRTKVSAAEMLDFIEASSFGNFLSAIPSDLHDTLRTDLRQALEAKSGGDGLAYRDYGMMVVARKLG
jgi:hypothetical protein